MCVGGAGAGAVVCVSVWSGGGGVGVGVGLCVCVCGWVRAIALRSLRDAREPALVGYRFRQGLGRV
jgi:hypothetical protein